MSLVRSCFRRSHPRAALAVTCLFACFVVAVLVAMRLHRRPSGPLEIGIWYWHRPFSVPPADRRLLAEMGVRQLFVHSGTFHHSDGDKQVRLLLPQAWKDDAGKLPIHLVFNADSSVLRHYEEIGEGTLTKAVVSETQAQRERAERAGLKVVGIQLDFDFPTRLLPAYTHLLKSLRPSLPALCSLSVTLLPTWYTSRNIDELLASVDFAAPQFYEAQVPLERENFATVTSPNRLARGLKTAGRYSGTPFYAGLSAYGHAVVYDGHGRLRGVFHDAGSDELLRRPEFRMIGNHMAADPTGKPALPERSGIGERIIEFGPGRPGGTDFRLVYDLPTPALVAQQWARVQNERPDNCRGVILFRYPEPRETATLPLPTLADVLAGRKTTPHLRVTMHTRRRAPWEAVEGNTNGPSALLLYVTVTNDGSAPIRIAPDGLELTLQFDRPGIEELSPGGFLTATAFAGNPNQRSGLLRADGLVLRAARLSPGEAITTGAITLLPTGVKRLHGTWRVGNPDDSGTVTGFIPDTDLTPAVAGSDTTGGIR